MPSSCKSLVPSELKPMNIFYVWYAELCRRSNTSPLAIVKPAKPKNDTVLDFTVDRIKPDEWTPILSALRLDTSLHVVAVRNRVVGCKFLYEINTEDRLRRMKRRCASLWTDYVLRSLMRSVSCCVKNTRVLSTLELDGLPLCGEYLELLLQSLRNNKTIKTLSFKHCPITDGGCQQLCVHLRFMPNVEVLNLTSCDLSSISGQHIASVIKHQQIYRYCESWHNSLRYEDPTIGTMAGLKRITLNNNPNMGDEGLSYILDELDDDLWIKAIDMQKCSISENMSNRLIDVVEYSRSLEVADFRNNEHLGFATVEKILEVLERKQQFGNDPEYQWCVTATTFYDFENFENSRSNLSGVSGMIQKSKSAPLRQIEATSRVGVRPPMRRTKTMALIDRKPKNAPHNNNHTQLDKKQLDVAKKQLSDLNNRLQDEICKRKQTEKSNAELQKKLNDIRRLGSLHQNSEVENTENHVPTGVVCMNVNFKPEAAKKNMVQNSKVTNTKTTKDSSKVMNDKEARKKPQETSRKMLAQNIFEKFLGKTKDEEEEEIENDRVLAYYYDSDFEEEVSTAQKDTTGEVDSLSSESTISLEQLLEEITVANGNNVVSNKAETRSAKNQDHPNNNNDFRKIMVKVN